MSDTSFTKDDLAVLVEGLRSTEIASGLSNYVSNLAKRYLSGRCRVCNNLRPHGHEDAIGQRRGFLDSDKDPDPKAQAARMEAAATAPCLQIDDIKTQDILKCRLKDEQGQYIQDDQGRYKVSCKYCGLIADVLDLTMPYHKSVWEGRMERGTMSSKVSLRIQDGRPLVIGCQGFEAPDPGWVHSRIDVEVYWDDDASDVEMTTKEAKSFPCIGPARQIPFSSNSEESQAFVRARYEKCTAKHEACRVVRAVAGRDFIPTRLLKVSEDEVKLIDIHDAGQTVVWAALSHSWGGMNIITLRQESLEAMKAGIEWAELPATFQNAITVARRIGLDFVWIDSLCIIQDSAQDWEQEAAEMGEVYGKAAVVISAGMSEDPHKPFLAERDDYWWGAKEVEFVLSERQSIKLHTRRRTVLATRLDQGLKEPPYTSDWATLRKPGPLYRRAWAFQETFLASRVIQFCPGGLVYECKTHRVLEGALPPYPSTAENTLGELTVARKWQMIVKAYTYRNLTFQKDKLTSVGGIAAKIQQENGDKYVAGLWRSTLLSDLLWHTMPGAEQIGIAFKRNPYVGPTWSWASINRGVTWNPYRNMEPLASVVGVLSRLKGDNPFGEISGAIVHLKGRLLRCRIKWDPAAHEYLAYFVRPDGTKSREQWFPPDGMLIATGTRDEETRVVANPSIRRAWIWERSKWRDFDTEAMFLCMAKTSRMDFDHIGLLLGKSSLVTAPVRSVIGLAKSQAESGIELPFMQRVGAISNLPREWYDAGEEGEVVLE